MRAIDSPAKASSRFCSVFVPLSSLAMMNFLLIFVERAFAEVCWNHYTPENYEKGFTMDVSKVKRNETSPLVYHKTMNYGDCILEKRNATAAGMDERLFLNTKEQVSEGTVSNVFFVRNGVICTPQVSCGLLPGILREYLCETEDVEETDIYVQDLKRYQECFVTNSLMGIMPVRQIGGIRFEEDRVTKELMRKYQDMVQETINKKKDR